MGKFATQLANFGDKADKNISKILRRSSLDVLRRLMIRSPVDTGRFRGNWQTGVDENIFTNKDDFDKTGINTITDGEYKLSNVRAGSTVFIVNNLPYATRLENGWSQQAPAGMVGVTVAEWPGIVKDAVDSTK